MSQDRNFRNKDMLALAVSEAIAKSNLDSNIGVNNSHNWGEQTTAEAGNELHYFPDIQQLAYITGGKLLSIHSESSIGHYPLLASLAVGDGIQDDTAALQSDLNSYSGVLQLPSNKIFRITAPLIIPPGGGIVGDGSSTILADFGNWAAGEDYIAIKFKRTTTPTYEGITSAVGQRTAGFRLKGKNNEDKITYGCWFDTDMSIPSGQTTNYAFLMGEISLTILRFDTAVVIDQVWDTNFYLTVYQCRQAIDIRGFSVNVFFYGLRFIYPTLGYTSSIAAFIGVSIDDDGDFGGSAHRPEGISFIGGLLYGMDTSFAIKNVLWVLIQGMVIDGNHADAISIQDPNMINIKDNYIAVLEAGSCIKMEALSGASTSIVKIIGNDLVGASPTATTYGISFASTGNTRQGCQIIANNGRDLTNLIYAPICPEYGQFKDNFGVNIVDAFISVAAGGKYTNIDGNNMTGNQAPLLCSGATSTLLKIGKNSSNPFTTHFVGKVTLAQGATSIELTNNIATNAELFIRALTTFTCKGDFGSAGEQWVVEGTNRASGTFHSSVAAPAGGIVIEYVCQAIPYTLSI